MEEVPTIQAAFHIQFHHFHDQHVFFCSDAAMPLISADCVLYQTITLRLMTKNIYFLLLISVRNNRNMLLIGLYCSILPLPLDST